MTAYKLFNKILQYRGKSNCAIWYLKYRNFLGNNTSKHESSLLTLTYKLNCFQTHQNNNRICLSATFMTNQNIFPLTGWSIDVNKALMFMHGWYKEVEPWTDNHATGSKIFWEIFNNFSSKERNMTLGLKLQWQGSNDWSAYGVSCNSAECNHTHG